MSAQLVPYDSLNAQQREQVEAIEMHPEQIKFSGDIHGALHTLLSKPGPGVKGFALLADEVPVAFLPVDDRIPEDAFVGVEDTTSTTVAGGDTTTTTEGGSTTTTTAGGSTTTTAGGATTTTTAG